MTDFHKQKPFAAKVVQITISKSRITSWCDNGDEDKVKWHNKISILAALLFNTGFTFSINFFLILEKFNNGRDFCRSFSSKFTPNRAVNCVTEHLFDGAESLLYPHTMTNHGLLRESSWMMDNKRHV